MEIVRFAGDAGPRVGVFADDSVQPLPAEVTLNSLLALGLDALLAAGATVTAAERPVPVGDVRLLTPVEPRLSRDHTTFEQHVDGMLQASGGGEVPADSHEFPPSYLDQRSAADLRVELR